MFLQKLYSSALHYSGTALSGCTCQNVVDDEKGIKTSTRPEKHKNCYIWSTYADSFVKANRVSAAPHIARFTITGMFL